jgi:NDP-sugar pyrophosphorylase family protein
MTNSLAGVVLAAGAGTRLRPLTLLRPKPLCPVGNVALVDHALVRLGTITPALAVNIHHGRRQLEAHLDGRVHLSVEETAPLGTAGALAHLRDWIAGRVVAVVNSDTWAPGDLGALLEGWDGERPRVMVAADGVFQAGAPVVAALVPWSIVRDLPSGPSGLYSQVWAGAAAAGRLDAVPWGGVCIDCGTPRDYLTANLAWSGGASVIGPDAVVAGDVVESVVWPGAVVREGERLVRSIRAGDRVTVAVR